MLATTKTIDQLPPEIIDELDRYSLKAITKYTDERKGKIELTRKP